MGDRFKPEDMKFELYRKYIFRSQRINSPTSYFWPWILTETNSLFIVFTAFIYW